MKKNLFYVIGTYLLVLISISQTKAQVSGQPPFRAMAPDNEVIRKQTSKVSADLNALYKNYLAESNKAEARAKPVPNGGTGLRKYIQTTDNNVLIDITLKENIYLLTKSG